MSYQPVNPPDQLRIQDMPTAGGGKLVRRKTVHKGHTGRIVYVCVIDCFCAGLRTFLDVVSPSDQSVSVCVFLCAQMACSACVHVCKHCVSAIATGYRNSIWALRASALRCRHAVAFTCNGCGLGCSRTRQRRAAARPTASPGVIERNMQ